MTDVSSRRAVETLLEFPTADHHDPATIGGLLYMGRELLAKRGIQNAAEEVSWLLQAGLGLSRLALHVDGAKSLSGENRDQVLGLLERRARFEPLQYILGTQEFFGIEFMVNPAVLIPRPETELLVRESIKFAEGRPASLLVDIGTGSGCIATALATQLSNGIVYATDISAAALTVARANADRHGVGKRIRFLEGDLLAPMEGLGLERRISIVLSNPPYIPDDKVGALQPEVARYEPRLALAGGFDGLSFHRRLLSEASVYLESGGLLLLEVGEGQADMVATLAERLGVYRSPEILKDDSGLPRVVRLERNSVT